MLSAGYGTVLGMLRRALGWGASSLQVCGILLPFLREDLSWCLVSLNLSVHQPPAQGWVVPALRALLWGTSWCLLSSTGAISAHGWPKGAGLWLE